MLPASVSATWQTLKRICLASTPSGLEWSGVCVWRGGCCVVCWFWPRQLQQQQHSSNNNINNGSRQQQQEMTTDLRLQSLISDKDCSNICHLRPKIAAPSGGWGSRVLPSQVASKIAAKLQLQMYLCCCCWQPADFPVLFMKNSWEKAQKGQMRGGQGRQERSSRRARVSDSAWSGGCLLPGRVTLKAWPEHGLIAKVRWKQSGE